MSLDGPSAAPTGPENQPEKQPDQLKGLSKDVKDAVDKAMEAIDRGTPIDEVAQGMEDQIEASYEKALRTLGDKTTEEFLDVKEAYEKAKGLVKSLSSATAENHAELFKNTVDEIGNLFETEWKNSEVPVEIKDPSLKLCNYLFIDAFNTAGDAQQLNQKLDAMIKYMRTTKVDNEQLPEAILDKVQQAVDNVKALAKEGDFNSSKQALKNEFKVSLAAIEAGGKVPKTTDETVKEALEQSPEQKMDATRKAFLEAINKPETQQITILDSFAEDMLRDCRQNFDKYPARFTISQAGPHIEMQLKLVGSEYQARFIKDNQQTVQCALDTNKNSYRGFSQNELIALLKSTDDSQQRLQDQLRRDHEARDAQFNPDSSKAQSDEVAFREDWELAQDADSDKPSNRAKELRKQDEKEAKADRKEATKNKKDQIRTAKKEQRQAEKEQRIAQRSRDRADRIIARREKNDRKTEVARNQAPPPPDAVSEYRRS